MDNKDRGGWLWDSEPLVQLQSASVHHRESILNRTRERIKDRSTFLIINPIAITYLLGNTTNGQNGHRIIGSTHQQATRG